jgi:predicted MFS family arabinose efflux permease
MVMVFLPGRFVCMMAWNTVICRPEMRGAYLSLISTIQSLTIGLAAIVGGLLVGETPSGTLATYWLAGLFAVTANIIILILSPRLKQIESNTM